MKIKTLFFALLAGITLVSTSVAASPLLKAKWPDTNFDKSTIELSEVMSGGPPKDGIPAIDQPQFDDVQQAEKWLDPREPVIRVEHAGVARGYPLQLLIYHEIVNDQIEDLPISVTFCPLCNSSVVFDRRLDGQILDFGTTGMLRMSDMVMYDRQTESWWQQIIGEGMVGEYAGARLTQVPSNIVSFADFAKAHPDGKVVNRETGHNRPYGNNPYRGYDAIDQTPFLFRGEIDPRLPPMERVMHIEVADGAKLYPFSTLKDKDVVNDIVGDTPIVLFSQAGLLSVLDASKINQSREIQAVTAYTRTLGDQILDFEIKDGAITDQQTGSSWDTLGKAKSGELAGQSLEQVHGGIHFAFAWLAFNPEVELYQK